ncbi:MAG: S1C family serine protease, partial [bacterium]|nr:S1C family serine protease [bacterium]
AGTVGAVVVLAGREQWPWLQQWLAPTITDTNVARPVTRKEPVIEQYAETVGKVDPNVVAIFVRQVPAKKNGALLDQLYTPSDYRGTGVLLTEDGIGVTTRRAIPDLAKEVAIVTASKAVYLTKDFAVDPASDLVYFRISGKGFPVLDFADTGSLLVSQRVIDVNRHAVTLAPAISLTELATINSVRVVDRSDLVQSSERLNQVYQTRTGADAPGVPTFSIGGKLIGLHTGTDGDITPVDAINSGLQRLQKTGGVVRNILGVHYLNLAVAKGLLLSPTVEGERGAYITSATAASTPAIVPKSPADRAGLKVGDIILRVDDTSVTEAQTLSQIVQNATARATLTLTILRGKEEQRLPVTLDTTSL